MAKKLVVRYNEISRIDRKKEKSPDEIIECIKDHLMEIGHVPHEVAILDLKRLMTSETARINLRLTP